MLKKYWPLLITLCAYWGIVLVLIILSMEANQGLLVYPLDDTYIHMAIAKNTVLHHVWGITKYGFSSATSSPLWTAILVIVYAVFGVSEIAPLILNFLLGTLVVITVNSILERQIHNSLEKLVILLTVVLAIPLPAITITGMEHVLQILLTLCFIDLSCRYLSTPLRQFQQNNKSLMLLTFLVCFTRYEGLFLVFIVCVLLLTQKNLFRTVITGATALLPVTLYGIWSIEHGWLFLPNSILLKGRFPGFSIAGLATFLVSGCKNIILSGPIFWLLIISLFLLLSLYRNRKTPYKYGIYANLIFVTTTLQHLFFSSTGWFYRYEAYIVCIGIITIGLSLNQMMQTIRKWNKKKEKTIYYATTIILVVTLPFGGRILTSLKDTPQATHDRFLEHIQIAQFIRKYYNDSVVALNDIGAVAYFTDARIIDIYGLSSLEPYIFRGQDNGYSKQDVYTWTKNEGVQIAFLQIQWNEIQPRVPDEWELVSQWEIPQNVVFHDTKFGIFAVDPLARDDLIKNLKSFEAEMPSDLKQIFRYKEKE